MTDEPTPEQLAKLPRWARAHIAALGRRIAELEWEVTALRREVPPGLAWAHLELSTVKPTDPIPLAGQGSGPITVTTDSGPIDIDISNGRLAVIGGGALVVYPRRDDTLHIENAKPR